MVDDLLQKFGETVGFGRSKDIFCGTNFDDLALVHEHHLISDATRNGQWRAYTLGWGKATQKTWPADPRIDSAVSFPPRRKPTIGLTAS